MAVYKGDNTGAFGNNFITITLATEAGVVITKAIFQCGCIRKVFSNPVFPLTVNFTEQESKTLKNGDKCYLAVWDNYTDGGVSKPRKQTCEGTLVLDVNDEVVHG